MDARKDIGQRIARARRRRGLSPHRHDPRLKGTVPTSTETDLSGQVVSPRSQDQAGPSSAPLNPCPGDIQKPDFSPDVFPGQLKGRQCFQGRGPLLPRIVASRETASSCIAAFSMPI
ncbi:hypothetical protein GCM10017673_39230 [Streptosporangium violaceochromogenes]|nr:hypothetical protein GCM10017673_39230 [Streptosporangium violaceochromogenes]